MNAMKQTVITLNSNWLSDLNRVLKYLDIDLCKVIAIHGDYVELTNETHITIYTRSDY